MWAASIGLPWRIVEERGLQVAWSFWGRLFSRLGIDGLTSTAFYPHTDCQAERMERGMEQYLGVFHTNHQDDWVQLLLLAEFVAYNGISESTMCTLFCAVQGVDPRMSFPGEPRQERD